MSEMSDLSGLSEMSDLSGLSENGHFVLNVRF
nr:MAG TPA: hypothetical protein [Caudoviricetes sp.]